MNSILRRSKTVAVIGGSYVGKRLALSLAEKLPQTHKVVVVEANSHFHHLFSFPRFSVLSRGGEEKAFIPYNRMFNDAEGAIMEGAGEVVHARALSIVPSSNGGKIKLDRPVPTHLAPSSAASSSSSQELEYDYLALATGTQLQRPWCLSSASARGDEAEMSKAQAIKVLQTYQDRIKDAKRIVVVGGGAVGVQVALDIAQLYPLKESGKEVVVVHSRDKLMNKYHEDLNKLVLSRFEEEGISTVLSSRVTLPESHTSGTLPPFTAGQMQTFPLSTGSSVSGDLLLLCTGQTARSGLIRDLSPSSLTESGFIKVSPALQLQSNELPSNQAERIFALGDVAETGAWKTVRAAMGQVETVRDNILALIAADCEGETAQPLKKFTVTPGGIHLTLGLTESVKFGNPTQPGEAPRCLVEADGSRDMNVGRLWAGFNHPQGTNFHL